MNTLWYYRLLLVVLIPLLTLTLFTSPSAAKPDFTVIPVDVTFGRGECDGFTVLERVEGLLKFSTHFDQNGNFAMEIARFIGGRHTFTNSETGAALFSPDVGINMTTLSQDGST